MQCGAEYSRKQLVAIYAHEPSVRASASNYDATRCKEATSRRPDGRHGRRRVCGRRNAA